MPVNFLNPTQPAFSARSKTLLPIKRNRREQKRQAAEFRHWLRAHLYYIEANIPNGLVLKPVSKQTPDFLHPENLLKDIHQAMIPRRRMPKIRNMQDLSGWFVKTYRSYRHRLDRYLDETYKTDPLSPDDRQVFRQNYLRGYKKLLNYFVGCPNTEAYEQAERAESDYFKESWALRRDFNATLEDVATDLPMMDQAYQNKYANYLIEELATHVARYPKAFSINPQKGTYRFMGPESKAVMNYFSQINNLLSASFPNGIMTHFEAALKEAIAREASAKAQQ